MTRRAPNRPTPLRTTALLAALTATFTMVTAVPALAAASTACDLVSQVANGDPAADADRAGAALAPLAHDAAAGNTAGLGELVACLHQQSGSRLDTLVQAAAQGNATALSQFAGLLGQLHEPALTGDVLATVMPHLNTTTEGIGALITAAPQILELVAVRYEGEEVYLPVAAGDLTTALRPRPCPRPRRRAWPARTRPSRRSAAARARPPRAAARSRGQAY